MAAEDMSVLQYAGIYSGRLRQFDSTPDGSSGSQCLDIKFDLKDEFSSGGSSSFDQSTAKVLKKGEFVMELNGTWDPLKEREPTVQDEREWRAIQLRGFMDPKRFYKGCNTAKLEPLPRRYQVGMITGSSGVKVGPGEEAQAIGTINSRRRRKAVSVLAQTMSSDQTWTRKKYREIQAEKTSGSKGWYSRRHSKLKKVSK